MAQKITVFLVDDHEIVRRGVAGLLQGQPDLEVVGEASSAAEASGRIRATQPDVALLDVRLPDGSGIDICREIRESSPETRCVMLTGYDDDDAIYAAVIAGASGYILKDVRGTGLVEGIRKVASGGSLLDPALRRRVVENLHGAQKEDPRLGRLSNREREVLALIADGLTNRQIGVRLALAEKTVKNYVSGMLSKLGLQSRTQAAALQWEAHPPGR